MTLSDEAYQELRDAAAAVVRAVGVETGGSNIQFARRRETGELRVIEMNPRVSRSSALASKATGYPIAKVAAKLAVGYTLDEIPNDLTKTTPASFEPTLDYVVVKFPRFAFEKFPGADRHLGTQMKSVGEAMGIGRTFAEAFLKAYGSRELEHGAPTPWASLDDLPDGVHPWFRAELERAREDLASGDLLRAKRSGWSDAAVGAALGLAEEEVRQRRHELGIRPAYRRVDSCAGEVDAASSYYYSTWGETGESPSVRERPSVVILGSGPNRIGQGIEFDYCCVHAAKSFRDLGFDAVMVNCNPETVSTDYDTSDRLYFEPLTAEHVLEVCAHEEPVGVVTQFGGQTPLKLARAIEERGTGSSGRHTPRSTSPRTASASARSSASSASAARRGRSWRAPPRRAPRRTGSATRCSSARRTCSEGGRCGSATTTASSRRRCVRWWDRSSSTASSSTRSSSTSTRSATARTSTSRRSCSTWRRPASTPATRRASCRPRRSRCRQRSRWSTSSSASGRRWASSGC